MHYLVTGHTGFKGTWLTLMLHHLGATVSGVALDPEPGSLFDRVGGPSFLESDLRVDVRNFEDLNNVFKTVKPDVVVHLAARPLVRESYLEPRETVETNVTGTLNVLEASQSSPNLQARLIVTTDKVYQPRHDAMAFIEEDPLGGIDLYSASKSMADVLTTAWATSLGGCPTATARAGNVIGGGDISNERLMPDILSALQRGEDPAIRMPNAVRPWQHVLDCLNGYIHLIDFLVAGQDTSPFAGAWNFGPDESTPIPVSRVVSETARAWGLEPKWNQQSISDLRESDFLMLDSSKARGSLNWRSSLSFQQSIGLTVEWERRTLGGSDPLDVTREQINHFFSPGA